MTNQSKLVWGIAPPEGVSVAWGARAIYTENRKAYDLNHTKRGQARKRRVANYFDIQILPDRVSVIGDAKALGQWLDLLAIPHLVKECNDQYLTRESEAVVNFTEGAFSLMASPRRSHGYLYIGAWVNP